MRQRLIVLTSLGLLLVLGSPASCFGQAETESETAAEETASGEVGVALVEPAAEPDLAASVASAVGIDGGSSENAGLAIEPPQDVPDMVDESVVDVFGGTMSEPEGEGPELMPPEEQPSVPPEPAVVAEPVPIDAVVPAAAPAAPVAEPVAVQTLAAPSGGESVVIAQGSVEFEADAVVWRVVRYQAGAPEESDFVWRPVGFVVALDDPLVLVDKASGEPATLRPGEAEFVPSRALLHRADSSDTPVRYLAIELVPASSGEEAVDGDVLHISEPFVPSIDLGALVLARHELPAGRVLAVPDTGERNLVVVIRGAVVAQPSGESGASPLVAGECIVFRGAWEVAPVALEGADGSSQDGATIFVASMGAG